MATPAKRQRVEEEEVVKEEEPEVGTAEDRVRFDNPDSEYHDITLVVHGEKFYCDKITLAKHSQYFYSMFFHQFAEKDRTEITLKDPSCSEEFHQFLKACHGIEALTDEHVAGVLRLTDLWDTKAVKDRCLVFLASEKSKKSHKEKFDLGRQYESEKLKKKVLSEITSSFNLTRILPANLSELSPSDTTLVLEKSLILIGHWPIQHSTEPSFSEKKVLSNIKTSLDLTRILPANLSELSPADTTLVLEKSLSLTGYWPISSSLRGFLGGSLSPDPFFDDAIRDWIYQENNQ